MSQVVCLVIENQNLLDQAQNNLASNSNIELKTFKSLDDFYVWTKGKQVHGILCETKLTLKTQMESRRVLSFLEKTMGVAKVRWDADKNEIVGNLKNESLRGPLFWKAFLRYIKENQTGRFFRKEERREKFWNVEILKSAIELKEKFLNTKDVSPSGIYIICSTPLELGQEVEFLILELEDKTPIKAVVRWRQVWGNQNNFPAGMGVEFKQVTTQQIAQIEEKLGYQIQFSTLEEIENLLESKNKK